MSVAPPLLSGSSVSKMNVLATLQHTALRVSLLLCMELPHLLFSAACPVINHSFQWFWAELSEALAVITDLACCDSVCLVNKKQQTPLWSCCVMQWKQSHLLWPVFIFSQSWSSNSMCAAILLFFLGWDTFRYFYTNNICFRWLDFSQRTFSAWNVYPF